MMTRQVAPAALVVYGANGRAGRLVASTLIDAGHRVILAGRNEAIVDIARRLNTPHRLADSTGDLAELLAGQHILVNCAGPFAHTAGPLAAACLRAGVHYLDISGERASVQALRSLDVEAKKAHRTLAVACGAKGALGSWLLSCLPRSDRAQIAVAYAHEGSAYWRPTPAALLSVTGEALLWDVAHPPDHDPPPRWFSFPKPFAKGLALEVSGTEDLIHDRVGSIRSYLSVDPGGPGNLVWGWVHTPVVKAITRPLALMFWHGLADKTATELKGLLPEAQVGAMSVVVEFNMGQTVLRRAISTQDAYALTAASVRLCVGSMLNGKALPGVVGAEGVLAGHTALAQLAASEHIRAFRDDRSR